MAIDNVSLRKLLNIMFLPQGRRISALRADIRGELAPVGGSSGGDFHVPFWADAKGHVFGTGDLHADVDSRIESNPRRENLYPQLRDGFLQWWNERRRWTNTPFQPGPSLRGNIGFPELDAVVKIDNLLSVIDANGINHAVYPYFSADPALTEQSARLGLWALIHALPNVDQEELRILDVIRGQSFSIDRHPLAGTEFAEFTRRYTELIELRDLLMDDYREE